MLVYGHWLWNPFFCAPSCWRVNPGMKWEEFVATLEGLYSSDPDYAQVKDRPKRWFIVTRENAQQVTNPQYGLPFQPEAGKTLAELGVTHKAFLKFEPVT